MNDSQSFGDHTHLNSALLCQTSCDVLSLAAFPMVSYKKSKSGLNMMAYAIILCQILSQLPDKVKGTVAR